MFCEKCGNEILVSNAFCIKCGHHVIPLKSGEVQPVLKVKSHISDDVWWQRLLKVLYVLMYVPLLLIIPSTWMINYSECNYNYGTCNYVYTPGQAFWYCFLTLLLYVVVVRLIKIAVLYVAMGQKPKWKKEFKKFF